MDSDVVFFQNPERLFTTDFYKTYNTIFFHDRSLFKSPLKTLDWFYDLMPKPPSAYSQSFRIFHRKTAHEQESGVVVVNKKHSFMGILAACVFNVKSLRGHTYQYVFGDKETFWLGFEVVQQPYHFFPQLPGNIGSHVVKNSKYQVCSRQILHFDQKGKPLWVNGGLKESKYEKSSMAVMKEYVKEPGDWDLLTGGNLACLTTSSKPIPITAELLDIIRSSGSIIDSIID
jgi:hypothetical protein